MNHRTRRVLETVLAVAIFITGVLIIIIKWVDASERPLAPNGNNADIFVTERVIGQ